MVDEEHSWAIVQRDRVASSHQLGLGFEGVDLPVRSKRLLPGKL